MKWKKTMFMSGIYTLLFFSLSGCGILAKTNKENKEFKISEKKNTLNRYESFLDKYPESENKQTVEDHIKNMDFKESDDIDFLINHLNSKNNYKYVEFFEEQIWHLSVNDEKKALYIKTFPEGKYKDEAVEKLLSYTIEKIESTEKGEKYELIFESELLPLDSLLAYCSGGSSILVYNSPGNYILTAKNVNETTIIINFKINGKFIHLKTIFFDTKKE